MTINQAFAVSAQEGRAITHRYFSPEEYVIIMPNGRIKTEEGYEVPMNEFMRWRQDDEWQTDWSIWE